jgi:alcohol dehydrogenase class IV
MPSARSDLSINAVRAGALFASPLQRSDEPTASQVRRAIATAIGLHGVRGCAARVAQAYGEHPETALTRMRWALTAAASAFGGSPAGPAHALAPGHATVPCTAHAA